MSASKHKIIRFFKKHSDLKLNVVFQNHYFCEITNEGIDKGFCINMILRLLNISATDAIAIGNGMNDIAAFKAVNTSIAVNCKNPRIFQTATYHYKRFKNIIYKVMKEHIINIG
jgi:hydroxymethylpyrimidine pyrophosphatase-like HAD family hydrolase